MRILVVILLFVVSSLPTLGIAEEKDLTDSVVIVRAADLDTLSNEALFHEGRQYEFYARWKISKSRLKTRILEQEVKKAELERAKTLFEKDLFSEAQYESAKFQYDVAKSSVVVAEAQVAEALTVLRNQQLVLLEVGNPRVDYRYEMATNRKNQAESSRRAYESQLVSARRTLAFYQNQYEVTQHLFEKKLRTRTQVESWRLKVRDQKEALEKLEHEIEASQLALQGAEAAIERLKSES